MKTAIYLSLATVFVLVALPAKALPIVPDTMAIVQPDNELLHIVNHGDEYLQYTTTVDGYTVHRNANGYYLYVAGGSSSAIASQVVAHDPWNRSDAEMALLSTVGKHYIDDAALNRAQRLRQAFMPQKSFANDIWKSKQRGLAVLVNYSDCQFQMGDTVRAFYNRMYNGEHFESYTDVDGRLVSCTGSVRQYFRDNSGGVYAPQFDVVGPVCIDMRSDTIGHSFASSAELASKAMDEVVKFVDVTDYDSDHDGFIDFIVFIVAGQMSFQTDSYLWPHAIIDDWFYTHSDSQATFMGMKIGSCAFVTELANTIIDRIGTICHEFGHVLGLPDLYKNPSQYDPDLWDLMSGGGSLNGGLTPAGLSMTERMLIGFAHPDTVRDGNSYSLAPLAESNAGYILPTVADSSFFMLENRQKSHWDKYLPGHGLLVSRVALFGGAPYIYPYIGVVASRGLSSGTNNTEAYPGGGNVRILGTSTASQPYVWSRQHQRNVYPKYYLYDIDEQNGQVSFSVTSSSHITFLRSNFAELGVTPTMNERHVEGTNFTWDFYSAGIEETQDSLTMRYLGSRPLKMAMPSKVETVNFTEHNVYQVSIGVYNPTETDVNVTLSYSTDGQSWKTANAITGFNYNTVRAGVATRIGWSVRVNDPVLYRMGVATKKSDQYIYFQDFTVDCKDPDYAPCDVNKDGSVDIDDLNIVINVILGIDTSDAHKGSADVDSSSSVDIDDVNAIINAMLKE
ncbi:MAG: M6 family metalloprotease domain-containing protein [Muribaculaceae bacterium]|nr:M6 family metalloprotease domain-containing protein [Muribaculaceae bacterium]